ncbi:acetolactate synthase small subunit [Eubacteriales bacterium OttesenSCG-928-A19]|nr:acetolactate synthase small subunit [Eubacteriales bacterium OttesenSCG-928-A19]
MKKILEVLVHDRPGVLDRIVGLIRRRSWNIDSMTVGDTGDGLSQMTFQLEGRDVDLAPLGDLLSEMDTVRSWREITEADGFLREMLLFRVPEGDPLSRAENTRVVGARDGMLDCEFTDLPSRADAYAKELQARGVRCVRSGPLPLMDGEDDAHA